MLVTKAEVEFIYCQQLPDRDHYQQLKDGIEYMFVHLGGSLMFIFSSSDYGKITRNLLDCIQNVLKLWKEK